MHHSLRLGGADMWRFYLLDAFLYLGVLFYRYCPIPRFRLVPLLVISGLVAAYLKRRKRTY